MLDYALIENVLHSIADRKEDSHKGQNGIVVFIGGSETYAGAAVLTCRAILTTGVDLVIACVPEDVAWVLNQQCPEVISVKLPSRALTKQNEKRILDFVVRADAVVMGNGITKESFPLMKHLALRIRRNLVLDAGALRAIDFDVIKNIANSVLTPHRDELRAILLNSGREGLAHAVSSNILNSMQRILRTNTLLLKGHIDYIVNSEQILSNKKYNAFMTKGGTGDVLAGLCGGLLALSKDAYASAVTAAYINSLAGNNVLKKIGPSFLASDIIKEIPQIMKNLIKSL